MELDIQWLQAHIGALVTEICAMRAQVNRQAMVIADLQDQVARLTPQGEEQKTGPQLVVGD